MPAKDQADLEAFIVSGDTNDVIYTVGDPSGHVFIVEHGQIALEDTTAGTSHRTLLERGDVFGERALYEPQPRDHTARALSSYTLFRLDLQTFTDVVSERPEVAVHVLRHLAARGLRPPRVSALPVPDVLQISVQGAKPAVSTLVRDPGANQAPALAQPSTTALVHAGSGTRFTLTSDVDAVVGRRDKASGFVPEIDLTLFDSERTLSRRHLTLRWREGRCFAMEEQTSANGTFVNGNRLERGVEAELRDGDRLQLGVVGLLFEQR